MTLIKVKDGTVNETAQRNKMHKSRRKIIDVMRGDDIKDTFGWTPEKSELDVRDQEEAERKLAREELFKEIRTPNFCPKCDRFMKGRFDRKMYYRTGHCFKCQQEYEHVLRVNGLYQLWERMKVYQNEIAILRDTKQKFEEAKEAVSPTSKFVTSSEGHIEEFKMLGNIEDVRADIQSKIDDINELLPEAEKVLESIIDELKDRDVNNLVKL